MFQWGKRIFLFMAVNLLVMVTVSIILGLLGVGTRMGPGGIQGLAVLSLVWGMTGAFISLLLSRFMAKTMMGVEVINPQQAGEYRGLVESVHRMARTVGITTMPEVGVYDSPELNAFATGPTKNRALVAVSTGLLNSMNRDEVEGVLGHEISHIANGDMVTMTLVSGVVNSFVIFFSKLISWSLAQAADVRDELRGIIRFVTEIVLQIIFGILGSIVVAYFSRRREYHADAGSARLVGPDKMISALQALKDYKERALAETGNDAFATLKIASGRPSGLLALMSTHPDLDDRIEALRKGRPPA